jgi:hypothetical protein
MRRVIALFGVLAFLLVAMPAQAQLGNTNAGSAEDCPSTCALGKAQDWKTVASKTETVNRLNIYLYAGSAQPDLAIYDASRSQKAECAITDAITSTKWYSCSPSSSMSVTAGQTYWRAVLSPHNKGIAHFGAPTASIQSYDLSNKTACPVTTCNKLPLTWVNGTNRAGNSDVAMYADSSATPPPPPPAACADGVDNDGDGLIDYPNDPGCSSSTDDDETDSPPPPPNSACSDGIDNDGDGLVDYPSDPGCSSASDTDETNVIAGGEPGPISGQGYHQAFRDDFNTLDRNVWDYCIWYDCDAPENMPAWASTRQVVSNGILHLKAYKPYEYVNTITTQTSGKTFQYGYFETRMKWPAGHGSWPGFWLYSYQHANDSNACTTQAGEIDVMEGQGSEPNAWYGTVHSNTNGCSPSDNQNDNNWQDAHVDLTQGFHTYAVLWTSTTVTWYLDGVKTHSAPTYATDNQPMFLLLQEWTGGWTYDPDATTPDPLDNQIDYVTVWQK